MRSGLDDLRAVKFVRSPGRCSWLWVESITAYLLERPFAFSWEVTPDPIFSPAAGVFIAFIEDFRKVVFKTGTVLDNSSHFLREIIPIERIGAAFLQRYGLLLKP